MRRTGEDTGAGRRTAIALVGVISLIGQLLVLAAVAPPAQAATIDTAITLLADGSARFEDWAPGDTIASGPTNDGVHQSGDDLAVDNQIVRTLDTTTYRVEYSVSPPLPSGDLTLVVSLTNGVAWDEGWGPGASTCPWTSPRLTDTVGVGC